MGHVRSKTSQGCCQANDAIFELLSLSLVSSCTRVSRLEGLLELSTLSLKRRQLSLVPLLGVMDGGRERVKCVCVCVCVWYNLCTYTCTCTVYMYGITMTTVCLHQAIISTIRTCLPACILLHDQVWLAGVSFWQSHTCAMMEAQHVHLMNQTFSR